MLNDISWSAGGVLPDVTFDAVLNGSIRVVELQRSRATCRLVLCRQTRPPQGLLSLRERTVVRRLAIGQCQKLVAYDFGLAHTTISSHLRGALDKLGLARWEHAVLVAAAIEAAGNRVEPIDEGDGVTSAAGVPEPLFSVRCELSPSSLRALTEAEREVAFLVVDGCANSEIGALRRSSPRTVANQISSVFRKLSVHGRCELIRRLLLECPSSAGAAAHTDPLPPGVSLFTGPTTDGGNGLAITRTERSAAVG
jgi:DNA-binding NarL/FixJ family response regulator